MNRRIRVLSSRAMRDELAARVAELMAAATRLYDAVLDPKGEEEMFGALSDTAGAWAAVDGRTLEILSRERT